MQWTVTARHPSTYYYGQSCRPMMRSLTDTAAFIPHPTAAAAAAAWMLSSTLSGPSCHAHSTNFWRLAHTASCWRGLCCMQWRSQVSCWNCVSCWWTWRSQHITGSVVSCFRFLIHAFNYLLGLYQIVIGSIRPNNEYCKNLNTVCTLI